MNYSMRCVYVFLIIILSAAYLFAGCTPAVEEPVAPVQPDAFAQNAKMARGVNIIGYDPIWSSFEKARFKADHFRIIKEGGFSTVRINIHPFRHMDKSDNFKLPESWFKTFDWAVENALANDLMVILDFHEYNAMAKDPENQKEIFLSFWRQIAPRCKDLSSNVLFEILNEPNRELTPEMWNRFLKEGLEIIRETNPERTVVIGPGNWNQIPFLEQLELPEDDRNIIVTIHYYSPHHFTHQGAPWSSGSDEWLGTTWGTDEEKQAIVNDFSIAQKWSKVNNRPILLGEFGAYERADMDSRVKYTSFVARTAEEFGWSFAAWQFDSDFIVYDIDKGEWNEPIYRALVPENK
ncbi:glycoside hydrolase family 5 protein [Candidatus Latescibacterota bacterium]